MHETSEDIAALQALLDRSYASAGEHLLRIHTAERLHGRAEAVDVSSGAFRQALLDVYVPRYGEGWEKFLDSGPVYARIEPARMYAFFMDSP